MERKSTEQTQAPTHSVGPPVPQEAAFDFFFLKTERVHETFRILGESLFIHEIRLVIENTGPRPAYFVLGPLHRKFTQVDIETYDRDSLCEFIPSYRQADFVSAYVILRVLTEIVQVLRKRISDLGVSENASAIASEAVHMVREGLSEEIVKLVPCEPSESARIREAIYSMEVAAKEQSGDELARWKVGEILVESKHLIELVSDWYFEILQLREPIPTNAYRVVNIKSRRVPERRKALGGHRSPWDMVVEVPYEPIREKGPQQPSAHVRVLPPEGLSFRSSIVPWKRYLMAVFQVRSLLVAVGIAVAAALVFPRVLVWAPLILSTLLILGNFVYLSRQRYFSPLIWRSRSRPKEGFRSWETEFSIKDSRGNPIDLKDLIIAQQDPGLTYLVFLSHDVTGPAVPPGEYTIRVAFSLPRFYDRAPHMMSLLVWGVIYASALGYIFSGRFDSSSLFSLYSAGLQAKFPGVVDFLKSFMLPMIAVGVSTSFASLILFINRTQAQRRLLRSSMTLVLFLTGVAVLLPVILASLTLK